MAKWQSSEWSWPCMVPISFSSRPCCWNVYAVSPLLDVPIKNQARDIKKINVASTSSKGKSCFCHSGEKGLGSWHGKATMAKGPWKADSLLPGSGWKRGEVSCFLSHSCCPERFCLAPSKRHYRFCCPDTCNGSEACAEDESCTDRESVCKTGWWWASPSASEENDCGMPLGYLLVTLTLGCLLQVLPAPLGPCFVVRAAPLTVCCWSQGWLAGIAQGPTWHYTWDCWLHLYHSRPFMYLDKPAKYFCFLKQDAWQLP